MVLLQKRRSVSGMSSIHFKPRTSLKTLNITRYPNEKQAEHIYNQKSFWVIELDIKLILLQSYM